LPVTLARCPERKLIVYNRVSEWSNAGPGKCLLEEKTSAVYRAMRDVTDRPLLAVVQAVEEGKRTKPRRALLRAAEKARKREAIVVTSDLSRLLRAAAYHRGTNHDVWPTPEEFQWLHDYTRGVPLATVELPTMTEKERHRQATLRTGKAGRPFAIPDDVLEQIFEELGPLVPDMRDRDLWLGGSMREVALRFGVSKTTIDRAQHRPSPSGQTWRERALDRAVAAGYLRLQEDEVNGEVVTNYVPTC
jgi:hypothetical protein